MAEKSAIQRIKDLDAERAGIFDQAKEEALEKAKAAVAELNALGLNYTLTSGGKAARAGSGSSTDPGGGCGGTGCGGHATNDGAGDDRD